MRLHDAAARYDLQLEADGRSTHTRRQYARHVAALGRWLQETQRSDELAAIDAEALARFLASPRARNLANGRSKKATSTNALRTSVKIFFSWWHAEGAIAINPARMVRRAVCGTPPPRTLSEDEQRRLLNVLASAPGHVARRDYVLVALMLGTGLRLGSALALDKTDADIERGELRVRCVKNGHEQRVYLGRTLRDLLREYVAERGAGPLFTGRGGAQICSRQVQARVAAWGRRAGIAQRVSPHQCRHAFAMAIFGRTRDIALTQRALGHRSISSTLIYARTSDERLREVLGA